MSILALTLVALALPLAGVVLTLKNFATRTKAAPPAAQPADGSAEASSLLRSSLERVADARLAPQNALAQPSIELAARDARQAAELKSTVQQFAKEAGTEMLSTETDGGAARLVLIIPEDWTTELRKALAGRPYSLPQPIASPSRIEVRLSIKGAP